MEQFILFHGKRHPRGMSKPEVAAFLTEASVRLLLYCWVVAFATLASGENVGLCLEP